METAETKICSTCGRELPVDKFKRITRKRGNIYIYNLCRDCYNAKLREEYAKLSPEDKRKELDRRNKYYDSVYPKDAKRVVSKYRPYTLERGKRGAWQICWTDQMVETIKHELKKGCNIDELAGILGISGRTLWRKMKKEGWENNPEWVKRRREEEKRGDN